LGLPLTKCDIVKVKLTHPAPNASKAYMVWGHWGKFLKSFVLK
jgi:hypothetical protein